MSFDFSVVCGCQNFNRRDATSCDNNLADVRVTSIVTALMHSDLVFLALPAFVAVNTLTPYACMTTGKILVVVNAHQENEDFREVIAANAMVGYFPAASIVKAFNLTSTCSMESEDGAGVPDVCVDGDDDIACGVVSDVATSIGFNPVEVGPRLEKTAMLEAMHRQSHARWTYPVTLISVAFVAWVMYELWQLDIMRGSNCASLPIQMIKVLVCGTAIAHLAICFLASGAAGVVQLVNGGKHKRYMIGAAGG